MTQLLTCEQCDVEFPRKARGPAARYCSGTCKARACERRAKEDGRFEEWREAQTVRRRAHRKLKPCPYCGEPMDHARRVQCGKAECHRAHNRERMRNYDRIRNDRRRKLHTLFSCVQCQRLCAPSMNVAPHATRFCGKRCKAAWHRSEGRRREAADRLLAVATRPATASESAEYRRVMLRDPCAYCGAPSTQLDHIEPRSQGGPDGWENRGGTCASCNGRKQDVPLLVWMGWRLTRAAHDPWDEARRTLLTRS